MAVACDEQVSEAFLGDMTYEVDVVDLLDLFEVSDRYGEQQLIVLAAIEGAGGDVHVQLLGHDSCLVVDGQLLLVDATSGLTLFADVEQFGGEPVADVDHGSGVYAGLSQLLDDVAPRLRLQLPLQQVLLAGEVGSGDG